MLKFRGIPYLAFGHGSMFISRKYEIEKVWYFKHNWNYPIMLKSRILNRRRVYTNKFLQRIKDHKLNFKILVSFFNDYGETLKETPHIIGKECPKNSMLIVRDRNDNYVGIPGDIDHLFEFSELETLANGNVISAGFNPSNQSWYGWSHRAKIDFTYGDKIFEEDYGDDSTLYKQHGSKTITSLVEAKQSALNFAAYVS